MRRNRAIWIAAATLVFALMGGAALASIPDANGVIHSCRKNTDGQVRIIDSATTNCPSGWTPLDWNQTGPQGPAGPPGSAGVTQTQVVTAKWGGASPPDVTDSNRYSLSVYALCPTGTVATGGGASNDENDPEQFFIKETYPRTSDGVPIGWDAEFGYTGQVPYSNADLHVWVVCTVVGG